MSLLRRAEERYSKKREKQETEPAPPAKKGREPQAEQQSMLAEFGRVASDPRPDLEADSELWTCLLAEATGWKDRRLHDSLYALRKVGTTIERQDNGKLKFRPIVGPGGWKRESDYREVVNGWLVGHSAKLVAMLDNASRLKSTLQRQS